MLVSKLLWSKIFSPSEKIFHQSQFLFLSKPLTTNWALYLTRLPHPSSFKFEYQFVAEGIFTFWKLHQLLGFVFQKGSYFILHGFHPFCFCELAPIENFWLSFFNEKNIICRCVFYGWLSLSGWPFDGLFIILQLLVLLLIVILLY